MSKFSMTVFALCLALWITTIIPMLQHVGELNLVGQTLIASQVAGAAFAATILFFLAVAVKQTIVFFWRTFFPRAETSDEIPF